MTYCLVYITTEDEDEARKEITIGAGDSETVTFTISRGDIGNYMVDIAGNTGLFTVAMLPPRPETTEAAPLETLTDSSNWWIIALIVIVLILIFLYIIYRRRRKGNILVI